jgi:hypothetical protein
MDIVRHNDPSQGLLDAARRDEDIWGTIVFDVDQTLRVVGAAEDEMDYYWIVEGPDGPHTRHWRSMVGRVVKLAGRIDEADMAYLESRFAMNGSPAPTQFLLIKEGT